jgi:hypothetical protein
MLMYATAYRQDITNLEDLKFLISGREKCEVIIDKFYIPIVHGKDKPRTYREKAHKVHLKSVKKKIKVEVRKVIGKQLRYVINKVNTIGKLLGAFPENPLKKKE